VSAFELRDGQIIMRRAHLNGLPDAAVPRPYVVRTFRPGDETPWQTLYTAAFPKVPDQVRNKVADLMASPIWRPDRASFACHDGSPVAVALAWQPPCDAPGAGWVHWVATHPDHRRKGLARAVITRCLAWMRRHGCRTALLATDTHRLPAIRLYLALGFRPHMEVAPEMPDRWARVLADLRAAGPDGL